ncbi:hypothetical protein B0T16DRAFT_414131 [Cercophora newfieldiana]|uniref:Uncharacterized protein n=1 Tax=Cercophora newfieldiana TaxID=92897 RepID=A0AA39Y630_9PEZI|nr:hypothetical protein B0T16DRAFT_414131 [Cercophora newfieldiana]
MLLSSCMVGLVSHFILHPALMFCILPCVFQALVFSRSSALSRLPFGLTRLGFSNLTICSPSSPGPQSGLLAAIPPSTHHYLTPGSCFYIRQPDHGIRSSNYATVIVGQGYLTSTPLRNNLRLAHGKSLMCFNLDERGTGVINLLPPPTFGIPSPCPLHYSEDQTI